MCGVSVIGSGLTDGRNITVRHQQRASAARRAAVAKSSASGHGQTDLDRSMIDRGGSKGGGQRATPPSQTSVLDHPPPKKK